MRLDEFAPKDENQSSAAALGIMNFLKKQAKKKSKSGVLSVAAFKNMMAMGKGGGADVTSYLDDLQVKGVIDSYDDHTINYNSDSTVVPPPMDDIGMGLDAPIMPDPMAMGADDLGMPAPIDPMAPPAPIGSDPMAPPEQMEPEFVEPDPVEDMAKAATAKRF